MPLPGLKWPAGPETPQLRDGEIHAWAFGLEVAPEQLSAFAATLSPDEIQRADQFRFPRLRERYIAGRGTMRAMLGKYLGVAPECLEFDYRSRGKPALAGGGVEFNLAHSDELGVLAITSVAAVGVDVEKIRPMPDGLDIARRFFAASEVAAFGDVSGRERDEAFFNLWTRKESWLKATGDGISESLSRVEFAFGAGEIPRVRAIDGDERAAAEWSLFAVEPAQGFVGAVAIRSRDVRLRCFGL